MADQKTQIAIEVIKSGSGAQQATSELAQLDAAAAKSSHAGAGLTASWRQFAGVMTALIGARVIQTCIREFQEQEQAVRVLNGSLAASNQLTAAYSQELQGLAASMGKMAGVEDDVVMQGQAVLVQFGAMRSEMPRLTQAMLDMAAAGYDVQTSARALGAAVQNDMQPLTRLLRVEIPEGLTRTEKLEFALKALEGRFGGLAEATGKTTGGFREAKVAIADAEAAIGKFIAQGLDVYVRAAMRAGEATAYWSDALRRFMTGEKGSAEALQGTLSTIADRLQHFVWLQRESGQMSLDQAAAFAKEISAARGAADAYERLVAIQRQLRGVAPGAAAGAATPAARLLDPERAAMEMADLRQRAKTTGLLTGQGLYFTDKFQEINPRSVLNRRYQAERDLLNEQLTGGIISEAQGRAGMEATQGAYLNDLAPMARAGWAAMPNLASPSRAREINIEADFDARKEALAAYYQFQKEISGQSASEISAINAQEAETFKALQKEKGLALDSLYQMWFQTATAMVNNFAVGFSRAMTDFISGTKSAKEAFMEFGRSFLTTTAQMIMQMVILKALEKSGITGALGLATGGVIMAANGLAGVSEVSSATYLPKFNVVAGEAGREMLTVLAQPRSVNWSGIPAVIGRAGPSRLALVDAGHLAGLTGARRGADGLVTGGGLPSGGGGSSTVNIRLAPGLRGEIVDEAIGGAQVRILNDLHEDSPMSSAVKRVTG
jgi:hypothetical protein